MLSTTFTAQSKDFDIVKFAQKYNISTDQYWIEGTIIKVTNKKYKDSGFKFSITDEEDIKKHFEDIKLFLKNDKDLLEELKKENIDSYFDIGFTINTPKYISRSIDIDKDLLKEIAKAEIGLSISSYLASEDD